MFTLNTTVDDSSPLIRYAPEDAWQAGSVNGDEDVASYWGGGYMHTFHENATATFEFNGTGVSVLGGKRNFRGDFTVNLDGESTNHDAYAAEDEIQTELFGASGLEQGHHTLTVIVTGQSLDIDAISWWSDVGSGDRVDYEEQVVDDTSSAMRFTPQNAWTTTGDFSAFQGSSGHSSGAARAQMSYSFQVSGDAISIFGSTGPDGGSFTVQVDGSPPSEHSAQTDSSRTRVLLFQADNLGNGNHTIIVANEEEVTLRLDYAVVYTDPSRFGISQIMCCD
ncbi:hypothetical protein CYLTODRAFT_350427 [Cylindrobasidium torrendii FP15055 ss-10]|uniref:Uncharacterized protein n=1 Tax=Cylindrobasidium torrendii FP15055 ss-10 TaxID=1314674 RepID=A0A0D7BEP6_9AGAR|nr:hypothetical protein CYLTODRAFT_350427 [Cylindrobasidium torrendii FP15055 ss-10]